MRKHTTIDLDMRLLGEAAFALETKQINETIHAALREVVDARRRLELLDLAPDLTLETLAADRSGRLTCARRPLMELVDTSALILASRDTVVGAWLRDAVVANQVVICDQVALEYLRGARSQTEFDRFDAVLRAFPQVPIAPIDWERARMVFRDLAAVSSGYQRSVPIADALIAATAERHDLTVAHFDGGFDRIVAVTKQSTRWVAPKPI